MKELWGIGPEILGDGKAIFEWSPKGNWLAVAGVKRKVEILDRNGRLYDEIQLPQAEVLSMEPRSASCLQLAWDPVGDLLAILPAGNSCVYLWTASTKEAQKIDSEFKTQEFTCLAWSKNSVLLAVGTSKGSLLIYNARERKKTPYVGKHTKKIVCATWNKDNVLALASLDSNVTLTDGYTGETLRGFMLKGDPFEMNVGDKKDDGYARHEEDTYSLNVNRRALYIMQCLPEGDQPLELGFLEAYGAIQRHCWFGDGYILLGFKSGQMVVVSSHQREISEEVHSGKYLDYLTDVAYSPSLARVAMGGGQSIRVVDCSGSDFVELKSDMVELDASEQVEKLGWTKDGQVLTVATQNGYLHAFLAALPVVFDVHGTRVMYLTSLLEMSVVDAARQQPPARIDIDTEPAFCGLGPDHAALGMNNQVWFYRIDRGNGQLVGQRDYMGSIEVLRLNATHAAVLLEGRVIVHPIEEGHGDDDEMVLPPPTASNQTITCVALTDHFIVTGSKQGIICYYLAQDMSLVNEYRHEEGGISRIFPQPSGSRLVFLDDRGTLHLFNPVNDQVLPISGGPSHVDNVMWDTQDSSVFVVSDGPALYIFLNLPVSLTGARVEMIGKQSAPPSHTPLVCCQGVVGCRLKNGSLDNVTLDTHRALAINDAMARQAPQRRFQQALKLFRLQMAWECAVAMKSPEAWRQLGLAALEVLDIQMAIAAYRMLGDASMVLSLEGVRGKEDKFLLAGHVLVLLEKDHMQAQELFLRSSAPKAALEMRKDLKHWSEALKLAEQLDPESIPVICKEHAASLEMVGEYSNAKAHYQQAIESMAAGVEDRELEFACRCGIARTTLHMGDVRQGRSMALQLGSQQLFKECALILEGMQQLSEAAEMYERAGQYERAASIYIQTKNFNAAAPLMAKVSSSKLQLQFAKAKEAEGRYAEAAAAYEAAGDLDAVVRLALEKLGQPQRAYAIVRKTQSVESAGLLARFCLQSQDFSGAVEFLLLANQMDQAFDIAQGHNEMDTFARIVRSSAKPVDYQRIAAYYESRGEYDKAGDMWGATDQHARAIQLFLKVGSNSALDKAIAVVERTKNHQLGVTVLDYVNEEKDGGLKDEFRFKLNIAMGQYQEAARDAMEMARFEQEEGNYRIAHDKLFATVKQLEGLGRAPPSDLMRALMLLHSYTLVKSLIAINDHGTAARMLVRVARNISKFPKHVVPILTSTVIECHRAGLKKTAFEYASMLMRPEYRNQVAPKYKKKIELMVRKPDKDAEEVEEELQPCCFCTQPGPETELQCLSCQNQIPFDVATGKRMQVQDWFDCPSCKFACSGTPFIRILQAERRCPMCGDEIDMGSVRKVPDPLGAIRRKQEASGQLQ